MLQAGRPRVRFPRRSLDFCNLPNPSSCNMALESTQPLSEMSNRKIPGGGSRRCGSLDLSHPYGSLRPVTGPALIKPYWMTYHSLTTLQTMRTLHDGALANSSCDVIRYIDSHCLDLCAGRNGPVIWPTRSPDLISSYFYLWRHLKTIAYAQ
jgi:hypothetical protein